MNQLNTSLWGDESFTAVAVSKNFFKMLSIVAKDTAPPLYYISLFIWTRIFGSSEVAIRSLSVLLYLGTIFIVFKIAKKVWNKKTAFLAALLTLANPFLFPFAFEGRMYAILVFFVALSFYYFIIGNYRRLKSANTSSMEWGYILASAAALYSHHYAVFALVFQFFWRLVEAIQTKRPGLPKRPGLYWFKSLKPYLFIGLLYLPWLYPLYKQVTMVSTGFWLGKPKAKDVLNLIFNYIRGSDLLFKWQKYYPLIASGLILFFKNWKDKIKVNLILLGWVLMPIILAFILSQGKTSIFYDRYLIFIIPAIMLLLASGFRKITLPLILVLAIPLLYINFYYFNHPNKRPFRELALYIKQEATEEDFLINFNGKAHHLWESKYYGLKAPLYAPGGELPYYVGTAQMSNEDILKKLPDLKKIGVISSEEPELMEIEDYQLESFEKFDPLSFSWFVKKYEKN